MAGCLAELCPAVTWKAKFVNYEFGYFTKEISKQSVKGESSFLLAAYRKMQEEGHKLKEDLLGKSE